MMVIIALVLSGVVYILLDCVDSSISQCEQNITAYKESVLPHLSAWQQFIGLWEFAW